MGIRGLGAAAKRQLGRMALSTDTSGTGIDMRWMEGGCLWWGVRVSHRNADMQLCHSIDNDALSSSLAVLDRVSGSYTRTH